MSRLATRLVAVLAPVALLLPAAAHAEQVTVDDAVGDAKALNLASEMGGIFFGTSGDDGPPFLDAPAETATDVTRTTIRHAKRVTVTVQFRDLVETAEHSVDIAIRTPDDRFNVMAARSTDGSEHVALFPPLVFDESVPGRPRPCRSVRGRYDLVAETVTVSFPAVCIGKPRWIQVQLWASRFQVTPIGDGSVNLAGWADDAFRSSLSQNGPGRSPKVRRG